MERSGKRQSRTEGLVIMGGQIEQSGAMQKKRAIRKRMTRISENREQYDVCE